MRQSLVLRARHVLLFAFVSSTPALAQWTGNGPIWTNDFVGIGTSSPTFRFHVYDQYSSPSIFGESAHAWGTGVWGTAHGTQTSATGVRGLADATGGFATGVLGEVKSNAGKGVWGLASAKSGLNYGVYGETRSGSGWSGFFTGGDFHVDSKFFGVNRTYPQNSTEVFGVHSNTSSWGGMYMSTKAGGKPYYGYATDWQNHAYHYYDSSSSQWRLYVGGTRLSVNKSDGRVGIGTASPSYLLHVNGTAGKPGGGSWSNASDARLKKDVRDLTGALDSMLALRGVTYEYKDPEAICEMSGRQLGVIAQEVQQVFPGWVDEGDDGYKRVTYRGFEAVTIEALRELEERRATETEALQRQNRELTQCVADQKALLLELAARLDALEER